MRLAPSTTFGIAFAGALLVAGQGCTFLIAFDDVPDVDAGAAPDAVPARPEPAPDAAVDEPAPPDSGAPPVPTTPACDPTFPLDQVEGCANFVEGGQVCADDPGLTAYPGDRTTDVVTCSKTQGATCVRHCIACAHLPAGFPDQCDQCIGKPDGSFCGTDMGWQPENFRLLVTCEGERMAAASACSTRGCDSKGGGGDAACRP